MAREVPYSPAAQAAMSALGAQIAVARRELQWTAAYLAERVGVGVRVIHKIEAGEPTTAIGSVFEAAVQCGVLLFAPDPEELERLAAAQRARLALLPSRVRTPLVVLDDDF